MQFRNGNFTSELETNPLSGNRVVNLPDASGTIMLSGTVRVRASATPVYYVSPTGNDSNNGLTVGTPFLTIQRAVDVLSSTIDCSGFSPEIRLATGTYVMPLGGLILKNCVGVGTRVTIIGDINNRTAYKIQGQSNGSGDFDAKTIVLNGNTLYRLQGVEVGANFSHSNFPKYIFASTPLELDSCCIRGTNNTHDGITSYGSNSITLIGSFQVEGTFRWVFDGGSTFFTTQNNPYPFTTSAGATFSVFLNGINQVFIVFNATHTGTFTGKRFELIRGYVETYGQGSGLPGSIAGTYANP